MSKAMIEEVRAATLASDEREARDPESNGDQRDGDEDFVGEKPKLPEEKEFGAGRFKDREVTRAGQSVALSRFLNHQWITRPPAQTSNGWNGLIPRSPS